MHRWLIVVALSICAIPARAQFFPVGGATEWTQLANNLQLIAIESEEIKQYLDMVKNSKILKGLPWTKIKKNMDRFAWGLEVGQSIARHMAAADTRFRKIYPGYGRRTRPFHKDYKAWVDTAMDTAQAVIKAQKEMHGAEDETMDFVEDQREAAEGSTGRLQALQAIAALMSEVPKQLITLRRTIDADNHSKLTFEAVRLQKEADAEAAAENYFHVEPQKDTGNTGWSLKK